MGDRPGVRDRITYAGFAAAWRFVRLLPEPVAYAGFRAAADVAWRRRGSAVQQLEANLARVAPGRDVRALSRAGVRSYLRYWCDAFRLPDWPAERVVGRVDVRHEERVRAALDDGGAVCGLMHLGNWDHAGAWGVLSGLRVTTVAERLEPERLYARFLAFREGLGMRILPLTGGGDVFRELVRDVRDGRLVPLLADRDLSSTGVVVELAGHPARVPGGPAALALLTGRPLLPVAVWYAGGEPRHRLVIDFGEPVPVPEAGARGARVAEMTQSLADAFTAALAAHPEDWHMLQKVFVADLDAGRLPGVPASAAGSSAASGAASGAGSAAVADAATGAV